MAGIPDDKLPNVFVSPVETPPVLNNAELSKKIDQFASEIIGAENIVETSSAMVEKLLVNTGELQKIFLFV